MQWELLDEPPALLFKLTELTFKSGGSSAGAEGGNEVVPTNGIDCVFHRIYRLIFACTSVCRFVSLPVPLSRILIEFGMPE